MGISPSVCWCSRSRCSSSTAKGPQLAMACRRESTSPEALLQPGSSRLVRRAASREARLGGPPDLILMDIQLPVMDGYEVTRRIKADPALWHIPIIAVTSYALSGDEAKTKAAGCDGYIAKPFSPRQLLAKINQFLP